MRHTKAKCALLFHSMVQLSSSGDWSGITFAKLFRYYLVAFVYKCITMPFQKSLLSDDYENELELYSVLGFNPVDESCMGKVCIYDNDSGHQIKSFDLGMSLDEVSHNQSHHVALLQGCDNVTVYQWEQCVFV